MKQKRENDYWIWIGCILIIIVIPFIINFVLLIPSFVPIVGDNKDWLLFLSGYIGAVIGASISLLVMYKTFQNTKRENVHEYEERWLEDYNVPNN